MNGLENRLERLMEAVDPQPATMQTIIVTYYGDPIPEDVTLPVGWYRIGPFYRVTFLGGTAKERKRELTRLRESGEYAGDPCQRAIRGEGVKAINGGSIVGEPGP